MAPRPYADPALAAIYHRGNGMPEASLRAWSELVASYSPTAAPKVLDVGAGTGMLSNALAQWGGADVLGVDPSVPMIAQAIGRSTHHQVRFVVGEAEALPVAGTQFDLVLLSRVIHHLENRVQCAREVRRVLRDLGVVVIRTTVREHLDSVVYDYWPQLRRSDERRFPSCDEILGDFGLAGFELVDVRSFSQVVQPSLHHMHEVLATRPQSKFGVLSVGAFDRGLARLRRDADRATEPAAVSERYDVIVLARPGSLL